MTRVRIAQDRPTGYRALGERLRHTDAAMLFDYYGWELWIPRSALVKVRKGPYTAPLWAIESAKLWAANHTS